MATRPRATAAVLTACLSWLVLTAAPARAESVPNTCSASWWTLGIIPSQLVTERTLPTIAVPAIWTGDVATMTEAERTALSVEVRDELGMPVAGTIGIGFLDGPWRDTGLSYSGWGRPDRLQNNAWWRPTQDLAPGRYTMHTVIPPPSGPSYQGCSYGSYTSDLGFEVRPELPIPEVEVTYSLQVKPTDYISQSTDCSDRADIAYCTYHPDICCWFNDGFTHKVSFAWKHLPPGWSFYHVLELDYDSIGYPYEPQSVLQHPFPYVFEGSEPYALEQSFNPAPWLDESEELRVAVGGLGRPGGVGEYEVDSSAQRRNHFYCVAQARVDNVANASLPEVCHSSPMSPGVNLDCRHATTRAQSGLRKPES